MKTLLLMLGFISTLFGFSDSIYSFSASFEQRIVDDQNKTITYYGNVWSKRPDMALWKYEKPIEKSVYIRGKRVVIIEPELEQALIKNINNDIDFFAIISAAKPIGKGKYQTNYMDQIFTITLKQGVIERIEYQDTFENKVVMQFSDQRQNKLIDDEKFTAKVPKEYDIIKERL